MNLLFLYALIGPGTPGFQTLVAAVGDPTLTDQLLGPLGLTVGLIALVGMFITDRLVSGARLVKAEEATREALALVREVTTTQKAMADALAERNRIDDELMARAGRVGQPPIGPVA